MLESSQEYKAAIVGSPRHIYLRAVVDLSDPDAQYLPSAASPQAPWSKLEQLDDKNMSPPPRYATLERGRWLLDGSYALFPDNYIIPGHVGYAGADICGPDGTFAAPQYIQRNFTGYSVLQAFTLFWSTDPQDGIPADFTVEVLYHDTAYFSKTVTGNTQAATQFDGFTVYDPTAIRVTVTRWSLPFRRVRLMEFLIGVYEDWGPDILAAFSVTQQGQFSCLTIPYGTAEVSMYNEGRRFEPRKKNGLFQSIEERQGIDLYIGPGLEDGGIEYKGLGVYYQSGSGWKTGDNAMTMKWSLVDIIGLVSGRTYLPPDTLPGTLEGWIASVVFQLGENFKKRYHVDPNYAAVPVTAKSREAVTGKTCGDIIRWACMAAGVWPRAASATGRLTAEPLWNEGNKLTLDNLTAYPGMKANESLAALIFQLSGGEEYVVSGNATSSEKTVTIQNPFLHTREQALTAARLILSQYGGNIITTTGRGDPSSEIGDVDTVWLDESSATTARRMSQTFQIQDGVLQGCSSTLLQADGSYLYTQGVVITESGTYKFPPGVVRPRVVLVQGGQGGGYGTAGTSGSAWPPMGVYIGEASVTATGSPGKAGEAGAGGKVWYGVIDINPEQEMDVVIGRGGAKATVSGGIGQMGEETTFGRFSSANGQRYENGYTDIASGGSYARTGVPLPLAGTGDGGAGGAGGQPGVTESKWTHTENDIAWRPAGFTDIQRPTPGQPGADGASGLVLITWDKPEVHDE